MFVVYPLIVFKIINKIIKSIFKFSGSNTNSWHSGDHVEFVSGNNVDNIFVRKIKLYEEFKYVLDQLKGENSKVQFLVKFINSKTYKMPVISIFPKKAQVLQVI